MEKGGSGNGAFLSLEAHCRGSRRRPPLLGTLGYERKALGMGSSLHGAQLGNLEWDRLPGTLRDG
jgi:hypothetical protein